MKRDEREDLLISCQELRSLCAQPAEPGSATLDQICFVLRRIETLARFSQGTPRDRRAPGQRGRRASDARP